MSDGEEIYYLMQCPNCAVDVEYPAELAGTENTCASCNTTILLHEPRSVQKANSVSLMATVFVSHATPDREFIERHLIPFLNGHGIRTWYCKDQIGTGAHWERAIRDGLESSEWFLVVVSPSSVKSEWVRTEVDWAVEHRADRIIPVIIGPGSASDIHLRLRMVQSVDWQIVSNESKGSLLDALPGAVPPGDEEPVSGFSQVDGYQYPRPKSWHCIFCGWHCTENFNDYLCKQCDRVRPFAGGKATMMQCRDCEGFSLGLARHCEWCGKSFRQS